MLTRIRIEAEGATISEAQETIFATYDALVSLIYATGTGVVTSTDMTDEVYELTEARPTPFEHWTGRWYKGRAVVRFPVEGALVVDARHVRARQEWVDASDKRYWDEAVAALPAESPPADETMPTQQG